MKYYSLNDAGYRVSYRDAVLMGQAPNKGLFYPEEIPSLGSDFFKTWKNLSKEEIGYRVVAPFVGTDIPEADLRKIVAETVAFDFPLVRVADDIYTLELFHGPTGAFKDVGARFMSRCLRYFARDTGRKTTVLVATSGDTGGAVADAFYDVDGVDVIILFPQGKVSRLQEMQLTTFDKNIRALEIRGSFDDCQAMVKQAFGDEDLKKKYNFSSANSINVARWLSQQIYYFYALQQWPHEQPPVISVPSGNFGNICAALVANKTGLDIDHFVAACNDNDVFTEYIRTGDFQPRESVVTISNAMDIGNPSNFARVLQVFQQNYGSLKDLISSYSYSSDETRAAIRKVYKQFGYIMDPHGAVGYLALQAYLSGHPGKKGIFVETAHPAKFADTVEPLIGKKIAIPDALKGVFEKEKKSEVIGRDYGSFKEALMG